MVEKKVLDQQVEDVGASTGTSTDTPKGERDGGSVGMYRRPEFDMQYAMEFKPSRLHGRALTTMVKLSNLRSCIADICSM